MEHAFSIVIIALAAFILPMAAGRLRVPPVVVEILFGIVVGPSVLRLIHRSEIMDYLAELGFLLLMFLSGFEVDFGKLKRQGVSQVLTGLGMFGMTICLAWIAAGQLGHGPYVTLLLATTSVGLVLPTLRSTRVASSPLGQAILISALMADLITLIGVTFLSMVHGHGVGWKLLNLPLLFVVIALVLLALKRLAWWYPEKFERLFEPNDPEEMGIRACLALMFVFVGLSYMLEVEAILGAFLAGMVFAMVFRHRTQLEHKLKGFSYGFLIPIFFINVGVQFDLQGLLAPGVLAGAGALLVAAILVKVLPAGLLFLRRFSPREVLSAGVLLSARLSLVIAVATLGVRLGLMDRILEAQVILLAVVTSTLAPAMFRVIVPRQPEDERSNDPLQAVTQAQ